jgi:hypothetical protein
VKKKKKKKKEERRKRVSTRAVDDVSCGHEGFSEDEELLLQLLCWSVSFGWRIMRLICFDVAGRVPRGISRQDCISAFFVYQKLRRPERK